MAKSKGYNAVSNPNPQVDRAKNPTGVMSQGFDGNIVQRKAMPDEPWRRNVRYSDGPEYGEIDNDADQDGDWD